MIKTNLIEFDKEIRTKHNLTIISGSDEAGRGAMAGPIVVGSVILPLDYENPLIRDSKKLTPKLREQLYEEIIEIAVSWKVEIIDSQVVDELNPKRSSIVGMINRIKKLKPNPELCLIDGEKIVEPGLHTLQLIKGDDKSQSIAAASILAKVTRDRIMMEYSKTYPEYNFDKHKGYCTKEHYGKLDEFGITTIHRKSYKPVKDIINRK